MRIHREEKALPGRLTKFPLAPDLKMDQIGGYAKWKCGPYPGNHKFIR